MQLILCFIALHFGKVFTRPTCRVLKRAHDWRKTEFWRMNSEPEVRHIVGHFGRQIKWHNSYFKPFYKELNDVLEVKNSHSFTNPL